MILRVVSRPALILSKQRALLENTTPALIQLKSLLVRHKSDTAAGSKSSLTKTAEKGNQEIDVRPLGEKVKENTKTVTYLGVIVLGVAVTGSLFYAVFRELFSSKSPNNVYSKAAKVCVNDTRVQDSLGLPIKVYGEETRRGRRRHVNYVIFQKNGNKHMRMRFYLQGKFRKGTVYLEMREDEVGRYQYVYMFVEVDDILQSIIMIEDNRNKNNLVTHPSMEFTGLDSD